MRISDFYAIQRYVEESCADLHIVIDRITVSKHVARFWFMYPFGRAEVRANSKLELIEDRIAQHMGRKCWRIILDCDNKSIGVRLL